MTEVVNEKEKTKFWVLKPWSRQDGVFLSCFAENEDIEDFEYSEGISLVDRHPEGPDSAMYYDPGNPERVVLYDFVDNLESVLVANSKVKTLLDDLGVDNLEYLPVWLMDHRDQLASKDYFILNPIGSVDIIDMHKSDVSMCSIDEGQIGRTRHLVVDYSSIPDDAKLFRASSKLDEIFIRDDIKIAFDATGISGYKTILADGWNGVV